MTTPIRIEPYLTQISTHLPSVAQKILSFLTTDQIIPSQWIMAPFVDLGRCRQLDRTWRDLTRPKQEALMERIRISNCPSIPPGPNLVARCGAFFRSVMSNIEQGVCAGRREANQIGGRAGIEPGFYRGNVLVHDDTGIILGDLETHQLGSRFSAGRSPRDRIFP